MSDQADVVAKYKRLLSLARSNLEANQNTLAQKDKQIAELRASMENVYKGVNLKPTGGKEEEREPKRILRRVNVDGRIWILGKTYLYSFFSTNQLFHFLYTFL